MKLLQGGSIFTSVDFVEDLSEETNNVLRLCLSYLHRSSKSPEGLG